MSHIERAKRLATTALEMRRKQVDRILNHDDHSTASLERLAIIEETIALAAAIEADETERKAYETHTRHEEAGTLVDDGAGNRLAPPDAGQVARDILRTTSDV